MRLVLKRYTQIIGLVASGGLTFAYTRVPSKTLLILTLIGAAVTIIIGVLLFFGLA